MLFCQALPYNKCALIITQNQYLCKEEMILCKEKQLAKKYTFLNTSAINPKSDCEITKARHLFANRSLAPAQGFESLCPRLKLRGGAPFDTEPLRYCMPGSCSPDGDMHSYVIGLRGAIIRLAFEQRTTSASAAEVSLIMYTIHTQPAPPRTRSRPI